MSRFLDGRMPYVVCALGFLLAAWLYYWGTGYNEDKFVEIAEQREETQRQLDQRDIKIRDLNLQIREALNAPVPVKPAVPLTDIVPSNLKLPPT